VAAQVLEHFPSKWKPGFRWQNAAKHNPFIVIGRHGAGYRDRAPNDKTTGHGSARERHFPRRKAATGQLKSSCAAVESRPFSWEDRGARRAGQAPPVRGKLTTEQRVAGVHPALGPTAVARNERRPRPCPNSEIMP